jgi:ATP-dependent DNA helicase RecQ
VLREEDKLNRLLRIARNIPGTGIVYMRSRRKTVEIDDFLNKNGIRSDFYHAGLDNKTRSQKQNDWKSGRIRVMVSTNAFGMGIDKPDVRFVVHLDIPESLEAYFQEAGRGGRDGKRSYAVIMYHDSDFPAMEKFFDNEFPPVTFIKQVYQALGNYLQLAIGSGKDVSFEFDVNAFCKNYTFPIQQALSSLKFLERAGYLFLHDTIEKESKLFIKASKEDLYKFQVEHVKYDKFIKTLLRSYSGLFTEFVTISESDLARRLEISASEAMNILNSLEKFELINYQKHKSKPQITYLTERLDSRNISFSDEQYRMLKEYAEQRLNAVIKYLKTDTKCRSIQLLEYFGETLNNRCGKCDVCIERNKIELSQLEFDNVLNKINPILLERSVSIRELADELKGVNEEKIIKVVQWLLDNEKVEYDTSRKLSWRNASKKEPEHTPDF